MKLILTRITAISFLLLFMMGCSTEQKITFEEKQGIYLDTRIAVAKAAELISKEWGKSAENRNTEQVLEVLSKYYTGEALENIKEFLNSLSEKEYDADRYEKLIGQFKGKIPTMPLLGELEDVNIIKQNKQSVLLTIDANTNYFIVKEKQISEFKYEMPG
ncbi:hypothetical protein L1765_00660 [Microaerobacter geothermalis]|uniref:hypothetical protein n=1 Tax=Microaerobacter geothermalis TaxID=674972 RepID=UPI001F3102AE|nr:hypothetical protein [Microaerobacter geothermalis]MCF6092503.1 hypothetical protein [Microaerobacter geothermalis]